MDRRDFIKITAATGASATLAGCGNPEHQLIRFIPEEPFAAGIAVWKPSICPLCPAGCGVQVRLMDGEAEVVRNGQPGLLRMMLAKKLEGNTDDPISRGKLCVRGQAAIQLTYHPDRIRHPLKRTGGRGTGPFQEISWDEAMAEFVSRLDGLRGPGAGGRQQSLAFLTRPMQGHRHTLISQFLQGLGAPPPVTFEVFAEDVLREANFRSFGRRKLASYDLAETRYVLSFGADFLGTWGSPVAQNVAYGDMRQGRPGVRAKFAQVEARMSQTGANADEWVPAAPGTEGFLALGMAHVILAEKLRPAGAAGSAGALIAGWNDGLPDYTPALVEARTGLPAARIERLAREFASNAPALAIIGGPPAAHTNGLFQALAINALNALAGSVGETGGMYFTPGEDVAATSRSGTRIDQLAAEILAVDESPVGMLLVHDANPVFGTPSAWRVGEALAKIPYIVSFGSFLDETSILADLVLPDHSFLESWVDGTPEMGTRMSGTGIAAPVMRPLHQTRSMPDVILEAAQRLATPLSPPLAAANYEEFLKAALPAVSAQPEAWTAAIQAGGQWSAPVQDSTGGPRRPAGQAPMAAVEPQFDGDSGEYPMHFLPFASQAFLDGSIAHLPWLQELPDVITTAMWSTWIELNPKTAATLGIEQGDLVQIASSRGMIEAPAILSPGIAPNVAAMPVGQGHTTFTRYASGRGANPLTILAPLTTPETGTLAWAATRVRLSKVRTGSSLVLFSSGVTEHESEHR